MNTKPQPFDDYAAGYDGHFTHSNIGRLQRSQVWRAFTGLNFHKLDVLEINCGTGEDAILLARAGHTVMATDASDRMVMQAKRKAGGSNVVASFIPASFSELRVKFGGLQFDLIFSNFGGLNCANSDELQQLSNDMDKMLRPGGKLFVVIMGTACKWEQFYFTLKREKHKAFRRKNKGGVSTQINNSTFNTYYYSPAEFGAIFSNNFTVDLVRPIGLFVPPSYLEPFFKKHTLTLKALNWLDKIFGGFGFTANHADHFVLVMTKKSNP